MKLHHDGSLLMGDLFPISQAELKSLTQRAHQQKKRPKIRISILGDLSKLSLPIINGGEVKLITPKFSGGIMPLDEEGAETEERYWRDGYPNLQQVCEEPDAVTYEQLKSHPAEVHAALLEGSLGCLKMVTSASEKFEVLSWIFEPDILGWIDDVGEVVWYEDVSPHERASYAISGWTPMWNSERELSFQFCCKLFGLRPDVIQDEIEKILYSRGIKIQIQ